MLWLNSTTNDKREGYCLSAMQNGGTNLNIVCIGACHVRQSVNMLPVWLIQSTTEIMEHGLAKHSRREKLTKDDIPTIIEPVIDAM